MGRPTENEGNKGRKERRVSICPNDSDLESMYSADLYMSRTRWCRESSKYLFVYIGLIALTLAVLAAIEVAVWLAKRSPSPIQMEREAKAALEAAAATASATVMPTQTSHAEEVKEGLGRMFLF